MNGPLYHHPYLPFRFFSDIRPKRKKNMLPCRENLNLPTPVLNTVFRYKKRPTQAPILPACPIT
jgi:hypothetical protein